VNQLAEQVAAATVLVDQLREGLRSVLRGKEHVIDLALAALFARGHLLLQDVPGVGKTTLAASLAQSVGGAFSRIQFTADLLPGDITGVNVLEPNGQGGSGFRFHPGPIFANVVLADEINRTTPKTQSALFEAMEEGAVTVDGITHRLPDPYVVIATQNPFDLHGTYALPDSQLDRFLMRLSIGYPSRDAERAVLRRGGRPAPLQPVAAIERIREITQTVSRVAVPREVEDYMLELVRSTREDAHLLRGVSPRGAQALYRACQAWAVVQGRSFVIAEDVRVLAVPVLAHRVLTRTVGRRGGRAPEGAAAIEALLERLHPPG
jgi:MoxR-like ATPase